MDTLLRGAVLSYNRQEIVRPNGTRIPCAGGGSDNSRWEARRSRARPPDGQRGKKHPPRRGGRAYQRQNPPPPLPGRFAARGGSVTGGCARLRLASHRLSSVAPSGAGEHHDNLVQLPARKRPAREDGPSPQSVVPDTLF